MHARAVSSSMHICRGGRTSGTRVVAFKSTNAICGKHFHKPQWAPRNMHACLPVMQLVPCKGVAYHMQCIVGVPMLLTVLK